MKKSLAVLNLIFVIALLFSGYTLYNAVTPIVTGKVSLEMQDQDDIEWKFGNDTISAHTWFDIINGGNYEIRDVHLHLWIIHNESGMKIYEMKRDIPPVAPGSTHREHINASIDLNELPESIKEDIWKEYANFTVHADINAYFMRRGGEILVHYRNTIPWEPLIKSVIIDRDNGTIYYDSSSASMRVYLPYSVSTSHLLSGTADAVVKIYNGSSVLSSSCEKIQLGTDYYDTLVFNISAGDTYYLMTHSMNIPVIATIEYSGIYTNISRTYEWGAPFNDLQVGNPQSSGNTLSIDYSFKNEYTRNLDLSVNVVVYDSGGNSIGSQSDHFTAPVMQRIERETSVSVSGYPSYAIITITENVSGWHYGFRRDA